MKVQILQVKSKEVPLSWGRILDARKDEVFQALRYEKLEHESFHLFEDGGNTYAVFVTVGEGGKPDMSMPINREHRKIMSENFIREIACDTAYLFDASDKV